MNRVIPGPPEAEAFLQMPLALTRFGFGGGPDNPSPANLTIWLSEQVDSPNPPNPPGSPTVAQGIALVTAFKHAPIGSQAAADAQAEINAFFQSEVQTFLSNAVLTNEPFRERLVWFWANHFAVQATKNMTAATAGAFVRDAIRPYVNRKFSDMLRAVIGHPAMLSSLNNDVSVGPQSPMAIAQLKTGQGSLNINENLGRETLELFTMGADTGYTQSDVDALAYLLTGWTVDGSAGPLCFSYNPRMAQPGNQTLLGVTYPNTMSGCTSALLALGTSPITYQHLATKLATYFISDLPDPGDVAAIYNCLLATGGDLGAAAKILVTLPNAWVPQTKLRTPAEFVVAALRATGATATTLPPVMNSVMRALGQPTFEPPFPNGWSTFAADWVSPSALVLRNDWINSFCVGLTGLDPFRVADFTLGPLLSRTSRALIAQATSLHDQLTLLFCSPEFQRR